MRNEDKILELLSGSSQEQDRIVSELKGKNQKLDQTNERLDQANVKFETAIQRFDKLEVRVDRIEGQLILQNLQTVENTRALFHVADKVAGSRIFTIG